MTVYVSRVSRPYWEAIDPDERARIEAAVPEGHRLVITPGHRDQPGTADVALRTADNQTVRATRGFITAARCWAVLPRVVVTTDAGGYITSIEDGAA